MRVATVCFLAAALVGCGGSGSGPVEPGAEVGEMKLVSGTVIDADGHLFDFCNGNIRDPGHYRRSCSIPAHVNRLFIGLGRVAPTVKVLNREWRGWSWKLWVDESEVNLPAFSTFDRGWPRGNLLVREWTVILEDLVPGRHTARYVIQDRNGAVDATWTFAVPGK